MKSILIVEDSASMRQMISLTLKSAEFEVTEAKDGVEAIKAAESKQFDLILTDINMPNKNGVELTKELRSKTEYQFTPILLLTSESSSDKKREGRLAGATGWIIKPYNPDSLVRTINKILL